MKAAKPSVGSDLLDEIARRRVGLRASALKWDQPVHTPLVVLGIFERVGSNWFADTLRSSVTLHNEPFRLQLHPTHPFSALNPELVPIEHPRVAELHPYERHWLVTFVLSKYGRLPHVIKETNLFFAVHNVLALFPDAPIVVLTRGPVGVASSFVRGDLWSRWGYTSRYRQIRDMAQRAAYRRYRFAVAGADPAPLEMLTRLLVLNTLLIAEAVHERSFLRVAYENAVGDQRAALAPVADLLPGGAESAWLRPAPIPASTAPAYDNTFTTRNSKRALIADLDAADAREVISTTLTLLSDATGELPSGPVATASDWLADYATAYSPGGRKPAPATTTAPRDRAQPVSAAPTFVPDLAQELWWRNKLVTNTEFCRFLNELRGVRFPNVIGGTHLLVNEAMPHERGGRIAYNHQTGQYTVSPGYEQYPVYWVTWIGAAAYARYTGCRLPLWVEIDSRVGRAEVDPAALNAEYRIGDVSPVTEPDKYDAQIHHLVGNLQVWCLDGPGLRSTQDEPAERFLYGAAWNTPATHAEITRSRSRHLTGCSRGVGIRLVRDGQTPMAEPARAVAERLRAALASLVDRRQPLTRMDHEMIAALTLVR